MRSESCYTTIIGGGGAFPSPEAERLEHRPGEETGSLTRSVGEQSVDQSLSVLRDAGRYRRGTHVIDTEADEGAAALVVKVSGYALRPSDDRVPLLPIAHTVHRCDEPWLPTRVKVSEDGIRIAFRSVRDSETLDQPEQVFDPEVR